MNVTELARRLKMPTKELLVLLPQLGFAIGSRAIKVDERQVEKIVATVEQHRRQARQARQQSMIREVRRGGPTSDPASKEVKLPSQLTVRELADRLGLPVARVIAELMGNGVMASINERIDYETAAIISQGLGYQASAGGADEQSTQAEEQSAAEMSHLLAQDVEQELRSRPPVVVVMGHVDHGKTKLLDAIRSANVAAGESGGITQHIGAYQVEVPVRAEAGRAAEAKNRTITFLDTPGHEAFKAMRSRGGRLADIAILVVAADDGIQPQTVESIEVIQREQLPFVVAINKVDKETADVNRVKQDLANLNLVPEDWGGKVVCASISAKQRTGIQELLELVLLTADLEQTKADPTRLAVGTIIESHVDPGEGPVATVLVQSGTLRVGDWFVAGEVGAKVRSLRDFRGQPVVEAIPSMPVRILGLKAIPAVGDLLRVVADPAKAREKMQTKQYKSAATMAAVSALPSGPAVEETVADQQLLPVVLKADVLGSAEAISAALAKLRVRQARVKVIKQGLGNVTETDIQAAEAAQGVVYGFHVQNTPTAERLAQDKKVEVKLFEVIYQLLDDAEGRLRQVAGTETVRNELGSAKVLVIFRSGKREMVLGAKVLDGSIKPGTKVKVERAAASGEPLQLVGWGEATGLRIGKEEVKQAAAGEEFGLLLTGEPVVQVGDSLVFFEEKVV